MTSATALPHTKRGSLNGISKQEPSIMQVAARAGLLSLSPSDLVFETSQEFGAAYYDYVLSTASFNEEWCSKSPSSSTQNCQVLFLAKLDSHTNVEWFETAKVYPETLTSNGIPCTELAMIIMGTIIWRDKITRSKLLCLVKELNDENGVALEALKRATGKFKCFHHVLTIGSRRSSASSNCSSSSSYRSSISSTSSQDSMKLRVMMCQSRTEISEVPSQAIRDTKFLLVPSSNPLLCLCFPLT
ncbi:hypothetical protein Ddc_00892 [Ditylenchus destructor]|nr:hypothetical protein Ddc_00892 [Ditylenchus destructor]